MLEQKLLTRLEGVKAHGNGKWLAKCPAHNDRSPSLSIKSIDNEKIIIHCFAGCRTIDVLEAIGLNFNDLFPERLSNSYIQRKPLPKFSAYELFPLLVQEAVILALAWDELLTSGSMSDSDCQRTKQAYQCVMRLHAEVSK